MNAQSESPSQQREWIKILALVGAIAIPLIIVWALGHRERTIVANEQNAAMSLNTLKNVQASWRESDFDGNAVKDFWVLDIAGFYDEQDAAGEPIPTSSLPHFDRFDAKPKIEKPGCV